MAGVHVRLCVRLEFVKGAGAATVVPRTGRTTVGRTDGAGGRRERRLSGTPATTTGGGQLLQLLLLVAVAAQAQDDANWRAAAAAAAARWLLQLVSVLAGVPTQRTNEHNET